jgi:hypothetical protein
MKCHTNDNSTSSTQLPHKFSYIVAILGHKDFESPNTYSGKIAVPPGGGGLRCNNNNNNVENVVTQSRTGLQIYEGRDDQLNRPGPMG